MTPTFRERAATQESGGIKQRAGGAREASGRSVGGAGVEETGESGPRGLPGEASCGEAPGQAVWSRAGQAMAPCCTQTGLITGGGVGGGEASPQGDLDYVVRCCHTTVISQFT